MKLQFFHFIAVFLIKVKSFCSSRSSEKHRYDFSKPYPFLLVNVGSGVSVLAVYGPSNYKRISGTR